jgi:hypothetical protein
MVIRFTFGDTNWYSNHTVRLSLSKPVLLSYRFRQALADSFSKAKFETLLV